MAGETLCKCPCAEANDPYAEVLKMKSRVCFTLISSLWTGDDQNKHQLKKFKNLANLRIADERLVSKSYNVILPDMASPFICGNFIL